MPKKRYKAKGDIYERELADFFTQQLGLMVSRTPLSGRRFGGFKAEADLTGLPLVHVEAKRHERADWPSWMIQAESAADGYLPVVINRRNRHATEDSMVMMRLSSFTELLKLALIQCGYVKEGFNGKRHGPEIEQASDGGEADQQGQSTFDFESRG